MKKPNITRADLKSNIMKNVIFRIDYQGVMDASTLVETFLKSFKGVFGSRENTFHNKIDIQFSNIDSISETLSIPVREIEKQEIQRFKDSKLGPENAILDISKYFTTLLIECDGKYEGIDQYATFFSKLIEQYLAENEFIKIKRIGLRKIGGNIYFNKEEIHNDFEKEHFNFDFSKEGFNSINNKTVDIFNAEDTSPIIIYQRSFDKGVALDKDGNEKIAYQAILDIDSYYEEGVLNELGFTKGNISGIISSMNDKYLFDLFKISMTETFFKKHSKK
jgi:uncharacterized protein (TIGR04255 family)